MGVFTFLLKRSTWLLHTHVPTVALILPAPILLFYTFIDNRLQLSGDQVPDNSPARAHAVVLRHQAFRAIGGGSA